MLNRQILDRARELGKTDDYINAMLDDYINELILNEGGEDWDIDQKLAWGKAFIMSLAKAY